MAKKKLDPQVQRMMESFNRKPTAAEEADFYKRNAGGPMAMTSLTRGRVFLGNWEPDAHIAAYYFYEKRHQYEREWARLAERRRTYHDEHVHAFFAVRTRAHEAALARFYERRPDLRPADMLNPFLLDP